MTNKMTFWGVGPKYGLFSAVYCILMVALSKYFDPFFTIHFVPHDVLVTIATILILIGIPFYIVSLVTIKRAFSAGRLVTEKTFGMCRHPVYSAWIIFFVPGIMLLNNTWIGLSAPLVMYILLLNLVKKEEAYLETVFGNEYLAYKEMIPTVLPIGWFKSKI
jgi:protein-S-isoprenylcysteine O-methyltransferase Ste14